MIDTAVILAAGRGSRLRRSTGINVPKPIYPVKGKWLISRVMQSLYSAGIQRVIVVLGYRSQELVNKVYSCYLPGTKIQCTTNLRWSTHGTGISLQAAEPFVQDERAFICCMGDHLLEPEIIERTLRFYETGKPWEAYMGIDYHTKDPHKSSVQVALGFQDFSRPYVTAVGRDLHLYAAIDTGLYVLPTLIFKSILHIEGLTGDCDLCEAVDYYARHTGVVGVDVSPWSWVNINDAESVKLAEEDWHLCP
jgi:choline kinase